MKNKIKTIVHIAILSFLLPIYAYAQNDATTVIMSGSPIKKDMSDIEGTEQVELTKNEQINYRLEIFKKGKIYYFKNSHCTDQKKCYKPVFLAVSGRAPQCVTFPEEKPSKNDY